MSDEDKFGTPEPSFVDALRARVNVLRSALAKIENEAEFEAGDLHDEYAALKMEALAKIARDALEGK